MFWVFWIALMVSAGLPVVTLVGLRAGLDLRVSGQGEKGGKSSVLFGQAAGRNRASGSTRWGLNRTQRTVFWDSVRCPVLSQMSQEKWWA